jgi:signal transduction histidine kinase
MPEPSMETTVLLILLLILAPLLAGGLRRRLLFRDRIRRLEGENELLASQNRDLAETVRTAQLHAEQLEQIHRDGDILLDHILRGIRAPLLDILRRSTGGSGADPADLETIHLRAGSMIRVLDRLSRIARSEEDPYHHVRRRVDLRRFLDRRKAAFRTLADPKGIRFTFRYPSEPLFVLVHEDQMEEVCLNLFSNAVNFSPPGGEILVRAEPEGDEGDRRAVLSFEDRGVGIPANRLPDIFHPAVRPPAGEDESRDWAVSAGLAIVKRFIEWHGGAISVKSTPGKGSIFRVALPLQERALLPYDEVRMRLQTGDLILFKGLHIDRMGRKEVAAQWTHVGMAVCLPGREEPLLWESTVLETVADIGQKAPKSGPQLVPLADRLRTYETNVYAVRFLKVLRPPHMQRDLLRYFSEVHRLPFPRDLAVIGRVTGARLFPRWLRWMKPFKSVFCSELVAESYIRMGLLPPFPPAASYTPPDFSAERKLPFLRGASLGTEISIRMPEMELTI